MEPVGLGEHTHRHAKHTCARYVQLFFTPKQHKQLVIIFSLQHKQMHLFSLLWMSIISSYTHKLNIDLPLAVGSFTNFVNYSTAHDCASLPADGGVSCAAVRRGS